MPELVSVRASSLPQMMNCPASWEARYVKGLRLPSSPGAFIGTAVHTGTAVYDTSKLTGQGLSVEDAAGAIADKFRHPEEDVDWAGESPREGENIAIALHRLYCHEVSPKQTYIAVEATCESLDIPELGISLTGTTDRVREDEYGALGIADIKTGKRAVSADGVVETSGHASQIAVYELLASVTLGKRIEAPAQIIGLQVAKTARGQRAGIGTISGAREMLVGTEDEPGLLHIVSQILKSGLFFGNPSSFLCHPKYCPAYTTCRWRR